MLLQDYMPFYDVGEHHEIMVRAKPEDIYPAIWEMDMARSRLVKVLMGIRMIPSRLSFRKDRSRKNSMRIKDMLDEGFFLLAEDKPREVVIGAVGCFWKPVPQMIQVEPEKFLEFNQRGYGKIGWNILLEEMDDGLVRVITQTRVQCNGLRPLMRFLPYWMVIRPFSGMIRQKMLEDIKRLAEAEDKEGA